MKVLFILTPSPTIRASILLSEAQTNIEVLKRLRATAVKLINNGELQSAIARQDAPMAMQYSPVNNARMSVLVVGSLHLDVVLSAPHLPELDETVAGNSVDYVFGGKGGNQAISAARMGANVYFAGRAGSDLFGDMIRETLTGKWRRPIAATARCWTQWHERCDCGF